MPTSSSPTLDQLKRAIAIAEQIHKLEGELAAALGDQGAGNSSPSQPAARTAATPQKKSRGGKRTMSAEARERIAAAQRARWAKQGSSKSSSDGGAQASGSGELKSKSKGKGKGKRSVSPEARAKMAEAARRRWANKKAS
jgi:hypothetical protein